VKRARGGILFPVTPFPRVACGRKEGKDLLKKNDFEKRGRIKAGWRLYVERGKVERGGGVQSERHLSSRE